MQNKLKLKDGSDNLQSEFDMNTATLNFNATGLVNVFGIKKPHLLSDQYFHHSALPRNYVIEESSDIELWPTLMLDYSESNFDHIQSERLTRGVSSAIA